MFGPLEGPAQVHVALAAQADLPAIALKPAVMVTLAAMPKAARSMLIAADPVHVTGWVHAGVLVPLSDLDAGSGVGHGVSTPVAHDDLVFVLSVVHLRSVRAVELGCLFSQLVVEGAHDHDGSVLLSRRGVLLAAITAVGCGSVQRWLPLKRGVLAMAADESHLYWIAGGDPSALFRMAHDGTKAQILKDNIRWGRDLALDEEAAYVASDEGITRVSKVGLGVGLVTAVAGVRRIVVDDVGLAWICPERGVVEALSDSEPTQLITASSLRAITSDGAALYVVADDGLLRVPRAGGAAQLIHAADDIHDVAIASNDIYVATTAMVKDVAGRVPQQPTHGPATLIAVGERLYWCDDRIMRGAVVLEREVAPQALACGGPWLYWADVRHRAVMRLRV